MKYSPTEPKDVVKFYEYETGDKAPSNQIAHSEWYKRYVQWLELRVILLWP